eukprot:833246-Pelagomonas_calceolata.AAC.1
MLSVTGWWFCLIGFPWGNLSCKISVIHVLLFRLGISLHPRADHSTIHEQITEVGPEASG